MLVGRVIRVTVASETGDPMNFIEIEWQSELYEQEVALRDKLLRAPLGLTFLPDDLNAEVDDLHFGVAKDEKLIACLVVVPMAATQVKIRQMCVDDSYQGQGIGAKLMTNVEAALSERGFESIELNARDIAVGFYEKLGYEKQGEAFIEVSIPHFKMTKFLTRPKSDLAK